MSRAGRALPTIAVHAAVLLALLSTLGACGRVGLSLIPFGSDTGGRGGSGGRSDAGPGSDGDASMDAGFDAGPPGPPVCEQPCENANGAAECTEGQCVVTCATGYGDCDGNSNNGCETGLVDQAATCGSCSRACRNDHGEAICREGLCTPTCAAGFADCNRDAADGCEADLNDPNDCGGCGARCANPHGTTTCSAGSCVPSCAAGYDDCDSMPANGCETNIANDPTNCGGCGSTCDLSSQFCDSGTCQISPCSVGRGECDGDPGVGCETDLTSSVDHCGFCTNACAIPNGTAACASGSCTVAGCDGSYDDCDGSPTNGCETPLSTSSANCGSCGNACANEHGTTSCADSSCAPVCSSGWGNCDPSRENGCETALNTIDHCGMCGRVCAPNGGTPVCNAGICSTVCDLNGTFALKLTIPVTWPGTALISGGSGTFTFWALAQWTQNGSELTGTLRMCGQNVPDFASTPIVNEDYGITYPTALYDRDPPLPSTATRVTLGATGPGSSFALARSALMMGVNLNDPVNDAWPSRGSLMQVDSDVDGKPGLTAVYKNGSGFSRPPANSFGTTRAQNGYMAARVVFSLSGSLTSCTESSGSASVQDVDNHTLGCRVSGASRDCNGSETDHLDSNAPNFATRPSTYSLVKVADTATCSGVRSALP